MSLSFLDNALVELRVGSRTRYCEPLKEGLVALTPRYASFVVEAGELGRGVLGLWNLAVVGLEPDDIGEKPCMVLGLFSPTSNACGLPTGLSGENACIWEPLGVMGFAE